MGGCGGTRLKKTHFTFATPDGEAVWGPSSSKPILGT